MATTTAELALELDASGELLTWRRADLEAYFAGVDRLMGES